MQREKLSAVLNGTVSSYGGDVFYYQGLHDISSVLLFTAGERLAFTVLRRLVICHLRDCTQCVQFSFPACNHAASVAPDCLREPSRKDAPVLVFPHDINISGQCTSITCLNSGPARGALGTVLPSKRSDNACSSVISVFYS